MLAGDSDEIATGSGDIIFDPDRFEENDSRATATVLGSETEITERDLTIDVGDLDFYKVTAHSTGKLAVRIFFDDEAGDLDLRIQDVNGNTIAQSFGTVDNEELFISVVAQEMYFVSVFGFQGATNSYDLEIENFPAPVPTGVHLDPASDTGASNSDNVTSDTTPTFFIQTDVLNFVDTNNNQLYQDPDSFGPDDEDSIDALSPAEANRIQTDTPLAEDRDGGIAVEVTLVNTTNGTLVTGFAEAVVGSVPEVYRFTPTSPLVPGVYLVSARSKVFDGQGDNEGGPDQQMGRSNASPPLWVTISADSPLGGTFDLLASSDAGMFNDDNVTNKMEPAFSGQGPVNAAVFVFAQATNATGAPVGTPLLVGSGTVGSDATDGILGNGLGLWEVTVEPMADGKYNFFARFESAAGVLGDPVSGGLQFSNTTLTPIPNNGTDLNSTIVVGAENTSVIADLNVTVNIAHPRVEELDIFLVAPNGTEIELSTDNGGFAANYTNTTFDDAAATSITAGAAPFTGTFRPEENLAQLIGLPVAGTWTLRVTDDGPGGGEFPFFGDLLGWTLGFQSPLMVVIDTVAPNTPFLDLLDDTGRHDNDNITKDTTPSVPMTTTDPNAALAQLLFTDNLKFRIFDRFENSAQEVLIYDSAQDPAADAFMMPGDMFTAFAQLTKTLPFLTPASPAIVGGTLANGVHNLKLEVEDRAGNISEDFLLEITVDSVPPPVSFGLPDAASMFDGLQGDSDTGVNVEPPTLADRVTSDTTPTLWGRAEADSIVRVFLDANANGVVDLATDTFLGQTVAVPFDGNDVYPDGYWEITSVLDLNVFGIPIDGLRRLLVTAEDQAGNPMPMDGVIRENVDELQIFIDTQGPRITDITPNDIDFDLFDPKPSLNGFTPLVNSLKIAVSDLPLRLDQAGVDNDFLYVAIVEAIAENPGNFLLVGDHVGQIPIESITVMNDPPVGGQPATAMIILNFFAPLPDDRYTLTVRDNIVDPAGNRLDGESNSIEPQAPPFFPSGNLIVGGSFVARFTVDSRPEIGTFVAQDIDIDINGNFVWDPANAQIGNDATNVDISFTLPVANSDGSVGLGGYNVHDLLFAGKFRSTSDNNGNNGNNGGVGAGGAPADDLRFFDQLAAFGFSQELGSFRWIIDTTSNGVVNLPTDILTLQPTLGNFNVSGALPVAGNFDNNADNGDEIGLYNAGRWALDTNHNFVIDAADTFITNNLFGHPIVGDFDGDGLDDLAVFNNNLFSFNLANDTLTDAADATMIWGYPGVLDRPVAADMDQDGIDDIGLWVPRTSASLPRGIAEWYFKLSNDFTADGMPAIHTPGTIARLNHAFTPVPFGNDLYAEFGDERSLPIVGNFDPPAAPRPAPGGGSVLVGDYDDNGTVEDADYAVWRQNFGSTTDLAADGNDNGIVDLADMVLWRKNLGQSVGAAAASAVAGGGSVEAASGPAVLSDPLSDAAADSISPSGLAARTNLPMRVAAVDGLFTGMEADRPTRVGFRPGQRPVASLTSDDLLVMAFRPPVESDSIEALAGSRNEFRGAHEIVDGLMARFAGIRGVFDSF
jgi:subtilisin-like proprotein convertase family protein